MCKTQKDYDVIDSVAVAVVPIVVLGIVTEFQISYSSTNECSQFVCLCFTFLSFILN